MLELFIFLKKSTKRENQLSVITHANTSNGIKFQIFWEKSWGMMLYLSNAPLKM